ncbi:MAG: branched-chain amino acid ABC transporter permease [Betaproteobacteria bacterium]|nr:branched-chain amino acid ABC transporter permease [Betaproteobacteria bacterium]
MFFDPANHKHPAFREGMRDIFAVAPGIWAWGLMTGVAMVQSGLSVDVATAMTVLVYAGSSQLAATPMMAAGAPVWVVLATAFCVNLRFVVFSMHLRPYLMPWPRWQRMCVGYLTADLSYVMFVKRFPQPATDPAGQRTEMAYLSGNVFLNWIGWQVASLLGVFMASHIPGSWGLGFAGVLALVGVMCSLADTRWRRMSAGISGAAAVAACALPLKLNILVGIAAAVAMCLLLERTTMSEKEASA